jgi:hypothetical protein
MGQLVDILVLKMLTAGEDAAQQDGGIDGRHFRVPHSFACVDIGKVVEEPAVRGEFVPQKRQ